MERLGLEDGEREDNTSDAKCEVLAGHNACMAGQRCICPCVALSAPWYACSVTPVMMSNRLRISSEKLWNSSGP